MGEDQYQTPGPPGSEPRQAPELPPLEPSPPEPPEPSSPEPGYFTPKPGRRKSLNRSIFEFIAIVAGAIVIAYFLQAFLVKPFQIPSESMVHTLEVGDRVLVNRQAYRFSSLKRGDVVVFTSPVDPDTDLIKRVIAVGGDSVEIRRGQVIINGEPQVEPYVNGQDVSNFPRQTVPDGTMFVLGDNRPSSQDSRYWPSPWVPQDNIIGQAFMIYWPLDRITWLG